ALDLIDVPSLVKACTDQWYNQTLCKVNDSVVRLGVMQGEYHWHKHDDDDEFFFVLGGTFIIDLEGRSVALSPQQGFVVPKGVIHRTRAPEKAVVLMVETATIVPTGDACHGNTSVGPVRMDIGAISVGPNPPKDIYVVIEIPLGGAPVKYELDKASGALMVDRFLHPAMFYPGNYGFIPKTLSADGDPCDVLVVTQVQVVPGAIVRCRPVGALLMEDEAGRDEKIIAVPVDALAP